MGIESSSTSSVRMKQYAIATAATVGAIILVIPVLMMINASVRSIQEILAYPPKLIPEQVSLEYYQKVINNKENLQHFRNSTILSLSTLTISVTLGYLAAYGFSRFRLRGHNVMLLGILSILMIPRVLLIVPYFQLAVTFNVRDTIMGLVMVNVAFTLPIAIWLLKGYLDSIPVELEEAAMVDGCSRLQAVWKILVPVSAPGIVGIGTFIFIASWNEYILAIIMTDSPDSQPLTVLLAKFFGFVARDWSSIMALSTLASLPLVILFIVFQRWVVRGLTSGAVK